MKLSLLILLLVPGLFLPVSGASPDGLTAYYKLDEGKGDIARDSSGNGLDARLVGTTWEKFGVRGQAVRFDPARKAHIRLPLDTRLKLDKAMTLSLYFKVDEFYKGLALFSLGNYYRGWTSYIYKSFIAFASHERGSRDKRSGGICRVKVGAGTGPLVPFHNVVFTVGPDPDNPSQNQVCIYLDGRLCSNKGISAFPLRAPIRTSDRIPITIGAFSAAECQWFSGIIDEIKIYSRVLSGSEIEADYRKTISAPGEDRAEAVKLKKV